MQLPNLKNFLLVRASAEITLQVADFLRMTVSPDCGFLDVFSNTLDFGICSGLQMTINASVGVLM
jgi:hypothetical protein